MKKKRLNRIVSLVLSAAMVCAMAAAGTGAAFAAGDTYENRKTNLIADPGFDLPNGFVTDNSIGRWNNWAVSQSATEGVNGSSCVAFSAKESSLQYNVDGSTLQPGVTYIFSVWVKVESGDTLQVGVKDYGGAQKTTSTAGGNWTQYSVEFTYLSGNPVLYIYNNVSSGTAAAGYVDDASLIAKGDVEYAKITNGEIEVDGVNLDLSKFEAVYTSSINSAEAKTLALTVKNGTLTFTPFEAVPVEQTITVILSYGDERITLSFDIEASGEAVVPLQLDTLNVTNGTAVITLKEKPTVAPTVNDFEFGLTVDGDTAPFYVSSFSYNGDKTVTVKFDPVSSSLTADREVTLTVTAGGGVKSVSFTVAKATSHTYYVSSSEGSDSNDGLSREQPFQSIDKLNELIFVPGDRILFKRGDTFVGMFKPSGSGMEGAPIVVSGYGEGDRPVLQPDEDAVFTYGLGSAQAYPRSVNGAIWLENIDHWEICGLELCDPSYDPDFYETGDLEVFNAGIRLVNVDKGDLSHFVFDDLVIHGFRGPSTNPGKTAGGIQFNVNTVDFIPSCFVDVSITNCEIYECGRSGVNSITRWGYRYYQDNGSGWPSFPSSGEYDKNCPYYPNRNLYIANCTFRDIDGDGVIVDTWSNAVLENNTVYRCAMHLCTSMRAAVGLFNWNSDNVVFQYNECYSNGVNATRHTTGSHTVEQGITAQDGHGIEVDALNQNTWVQYNYLHNNAASMMVCSEEATYTTYNTVMRYNVTENDGCNLTNTNGGMGWFLNGAYGYNTQVYNNTFVLGRDALKDGQLYLLKHNSNQYKFYNNIFLYTGDAPVGVTSWQDNTDWQNNIFININGLPAEDNANYPNISLTREQGEALFAGGKGADAYRLTTGEYDGKGIHLDSMDDGMLTGVDLAGHHVVSPGIGAFQFAE